MSSKTTMTHDADAPTQAELTEAHVGLAKEKLGEAGAHLKQAAGLAGETIREAASAATAQLGAGAGKVRGELGEAAGATGDAAAHVGAIADETLEQVMGKGKAFLASAQGLIREHPVAAFGAAFAVGWLLSRATRR